MTDTTRTLAAVHIVTEALDWRGLLDGPQGRAARAVLRDLVDSIVAEEAADEHARLHQAAQ